MHFIPNAVFYDCLFPKCKSRYNHFKSLKRHIIQQHPVHCCTPTDTSDHDFEDLPLLDSENELLAEPCNKKSRVESSNDCPSSSQHIPEIPEANGCSLNRIKECVSLGICRLSKDVSLPQSKITEMVKLCETIVQMLGEYFQGTTNIFLEKNGIDQKSPETVSFLNCFHLPDLFSQVSTIPKQTQFLKNLAVTIPNPVEKMLQTREDVHHVDGLSKKVRVKETFMYIPIIETLKLIFRNPETRKLLNDSQPENQYFKEYNSYRSGESYKKSDYFNEFPDAIRLDLYQDDVELGNALSSRAGINKVHGELQICQNA